MRIQARQAIFEFIEVWYNRERRHSSLGYVSPVQYELVSILKQRNRKEQETFSALESG